MPSIYVDIRELCQLRMIYEYWNITRIVKHSMVENK